MYKGILLVNTVDPTVQSFNIPIATSPFFTCLKNILKIFIIYVLIIH